MDHVHSLPRVRAVFLLPLFVSCEGTSIGGGIGVAGLAPWLIGAYTAMFASGTGVRMCWFCVSCRLAERCVFIPVKQTDTLESIVVPALAKLNKTLDHMTMSGRGLFALTTAVARKIEYQTLKDFRLAELNDLFPVVKSNPADFPPPATEAESLPLPEPHSDTQVAAVAMTGKDKVPVSVDDGSSTEPETEEEKDDKEFAPQFTSKPFSSSRRDLSGSFGAVTQRTAASLLQHPSHGFIASGVSTGWTPKLSSPHRLLGALPAGARHCSTLPWGERQQQFTRLKIPCRGGLVAMYVAWH
jgi:hypothetical protein